jgi:ABC-type oligopeptide transport system ATPase subunit
MAYLELIQIEKHYDSFHALKNIDLQVEKEGFVVFVGSSGCEKSTLLRSIGGLETVTSGKIVLDGRDITGIHPSKRNVAMAFPRRDSAGVAIDHGQIAWLARSKHHAALSRRQYLPFRCDGFRHPGQIAEPRMD